MSNRSKKIGLLLSFLLVIVCAFLLPYNSAFASTKDTVLSKAVLQGLYRCYTAGAINKDAGTLSKFHKFETLIIGGDNGGKYVALPASLTGINDNNISCKGLFMGDSVGLFTESGSFDGLFKMFGKPEYTGDITDDAKKTTLLKGMGYSSGSTSSTKKCVYYVYNNDSDLVGNAESYTDKVCLTNGELAVETTNWSCGGADGTCIAPVGFQANGKTLTIRDQLLLNEAKVSYSGNWDKFRNNLNTVMSSTFYSPESSDVFTYKFSSEKSENAQSAEGDVTYTFSDSKSAATDAIKFLNPSYTSYGNLAFTDQEKLWYYENTVTNWFYKDKSLDDYYKCGISENPSLNSQYIIINVNPSTGAKNTAGDCGVNKEDTSKSDGIHGFDRNNHFSADGTIGAMDLASVVAIINSLVDGMDESELPVDGTSEDSGENSEVEPTCMNTAGTSLGWILCPVLDAFGGATDWAYNELVEPALKIEPQLFTGEGDSTRDAWKTFRDIANIFFIILFLVVIFSQLTGVGIDNYGIKKILPKLIVAAVLINLSYIICVVFIDLSNILGNGLRNIFTSLGSQLTIPDSIEGIKIGDVAGGALTAITVLIALVGGVAVAITAAGGVVAFLVSLLVVALSAIIALFFLFLLLAAREAAIVVLTVLSPLAFACYILPNTQNIFKKWYQLGWRLLMVYPIAGLLIGGGDYVSKLLLSAGVGSEGFFSAFTAMIAGIVPIFFIPTVLKQSFALMGGLGAKIAGFGKSMGSRVSGNLDKSVRGGERFKNYQADRERNRKLRYARRTNRNLSDRLDNGETLSQRQRDRLARARMVESAEYSDELKRRAIVDGNRYETMRAGIEAKSRDEAINDRLALMQKNGVNGGAYSLENMYARMQNLEKASRTQALTDDEKGEMAALARGMASRQGGASMLNSIIRSAGSDGKSNSNFMSAMGEIYGNDSAVASKMAEKDAGASAFTEKFMPNGAGYDGDFAAYQGTKEYKDAIDKRIKSYSAGLNQGGAAVTDYVNSLDKSDLQAIIDNEGLYNSLDTDVRRAIDERTGSGPKGLNIQRTARQVEIAGENQVFDVHGLDSDTLLDIATNPKISDNDPNRAAAVEELNKRGIK